MGSEIPPDYSGAPLLMGVDIKSSAVSESEREVCDVSWCLGIGPLVTLCSSPASGCPCTELG